MRGLFYNSGITRGRALKADKTVPRGCFGRPEGRNSTQISDDISDFRMTDGRDGAVISLRELPYLDPTYAYFPKYGMQEFEVS